MSGRRDFFRRLVDRVLADDEPTANEVQPTFQPRPTSLARDPASRAPAPNVRSDSIPPTSAPSRPSTSAPPPPKRRIRPPGAIAEPSFGALCRGCDTCDLCLQACPESAIAPGADGLPTLAPARVPCVLCIAVPCAAACPTGALVPLARHAIRIARAEVAAQLCINQHAGESCTGCHDRCPLPGVLTTDPRGIPTIDAARCTGCGLCAAHCRAYPRAIFVVPP